MSQASSRNPSPAPQREASVPRGYRSRSAVIASSASEGGSPSPSRRNRRRRQNKKDLQNIGEEQGAQDQSLIDKPTKAVKGPTGGSGLTKEEEDKVSLKLRLDLNLEVDIRITARVHGDVTLSLLN